jgi:hypothetical protein
MKKAKTDKGWAGHKLFQYSYREKDIDTYEDKRQNKLLEQLEAQANNKTRLKGKSK